MKQNGGLAVLLVLAVGLLAAATAFADDAPAPLTRAHAHNDYEHPRPLLDALDCGFCSVEADVYLVDGRLLVAHDRNQTSPERTLEALYLEPLRERARQNRGRIYPRGPACLLFIDFKTEAEDTYAALNRLLETYADLVTKFDGAQVITNAVTVIISGNRPRATLARQISRRAACDGRVDDLTSGASATLVPVISEQWGKFFQWRGNEPMPAGERMQLEEFVAKAHQQGRWVRFWGAPDRPEVWRVLYDAGVDLINTDRLEGLRDFLRSQMSGVAR